jgi:hypothetical protein
MLPLLLCQLVMQLPLPAPPPPPPGAPAAPRPNLRLAFSAAYAGKSLELTWRNDGPDPIYVQIGSIIGRSASITMEISRVDGGQIVDWSAPSAVAGRIDPFILFLTPGARYIHQIPTALLHDVKTKAKIAANPGPPPKLRILFIHEPVTYDDARRLDLAGAGIWTGRLTAATP